MSSEGGGLGTSGEGLWGAEDGRHATNQARGCGVDGVGFGREAERDQDKGSREEDWSPTSFHREKEHVWRTRHGCRKVMSYCASSVADKNRDFFFAHSTADCQGVSEYASVGDLAGMSVRVWMELEVPEKKDSVWCSTGVKMLSEISAAKFTEHSERATMPSILAALGVSKSDRDMMGTLVPEGERGKHSDLPSSDLSGHGQVHGRDSPRGHLRDLG